MTMEYFIQYILSAFGWVLPFIILLGLLIFVHELGHFAVAKFFNVHVEVFSLGFGKKIFSFVRNGTTYCVSLFPLGGYVKMFGDDPTQNVDPEKQKISFLHKPVSQRIAIVLAGPLMNFFFAILIFALVAMIGERVNIPITGDILENTKAYEVGFRPGDKILKVNHQDVEYWHEVGEFIESNPNHSIEFLVQREHNSEITTVKAIPSLTDNPNILSTKEQIGQIDGLTIIGKASTIGIDNPNTIAYEIGLRTGDRVVKINSEAIEFWRLFKEKLIPLISKQEPFELIIERPLEDFNQTESLTFSVSSEQLKSLALNHSLEDLSDNEILNAFGIYDPELFLSAISDHSPAKIAGFQKGDRILSVNQTPAENWNDIISGVTAYSKEKQPISFTLSRKGESLQMSVVPKMTSHMTMQGSEEERYTIGIVNHLERLPGHTVTRRTLNPITATVRGIDKSWKITVMTMVSFVRIIQNKISPKNLGGFIAIGQAASQTFKIGITYFLQMMALISINLFILNLLPIPILDGGHLVFFIIEAIKGSPVSLKKMEIAQQVGLLMLIMLMVFALFNDFVRLFHSPF